MARKTHGASRTKVYRAYIRMLHRCYDSHDKDFHNYGGRGITVCDRWQGEDGFLHFKADIGEPPGPDYSIERVDNAKGYVEDNVIWADRQAQALNRRNNRLLTYSGRTMTLTEWSEIYEQDRKVVWRRLQRGWALHEALSGKRAA